MKHYPVILFDLYGTLVDIKTDESSLSFWEKISHLFAEYGVRYSAMGARDLYWETVHAKEEKRAQKGHEIEIDILTVFEEMFEKKGRKPGRKELWEFAERFRTLSRKKLRLYAGARELLTALRNDGRKVFLLSNAQEAFTLPEMELLGIKELFDDIFISSACGYRKPDAVFLEELLRKHALDPKDCVLVGNDVYTDTEIAKRGGMDCLYIHSSLSPETDLNKVNAKAVIRGMDLKKVRRLLFKSLKK